MLEEIFLLREELKEKLHPMRYEHSLSVSYICVALAMRYECNTAKAEIAGLLHDCAKRFNNSIILQKCEKKGIQVTEVELKAPAVIHAKYGAWMLEHKYSINDPDIINAVRYHTTGKPCMTLLEQILFVADYIEPRRAKAPELLALRKMAFMDLDETTYLILKYTLEYLENQTCYIDTTTKDAYVYYKNIAESKKEVI